MEHAGDHEVCNWVHGLECMTCERFFAKDSPVYRRFSGRLNWMMVLHNINAVRERDGKEMDPRVEAMYLRLEGSKNATDEEIAALHEEAAKLAAEFGKHQDSAAMVLNEP